jgi:hypothetical protein
MALALLAVAIFFVWQAALLDFGRVGLPGSGFFPFALGIGLSLVSLLIIYATLRSPKQDDPVYMGHRDVLVVLAALVGVAFTFERADTYLTLGVFVAVLLFVVGRTTLWRALLGASLGMVLVWAVFAFALGVRLPAGDFWDVFRDRLAATSSGGS